MKGFQSQRMFILNKKTEICTKADIEGYKKEYRSLYLKEYRRRNKDDKRKFTIRLTVEEYELIKSYAAKHGNTSLNKFIVTSALAYCGNKYLVRNEDEKQKLSKAISSISRNINQVTQRIHYLLKIRNGFTTNDKTNYEMFHNAYGLLAQQVEHLKDQVDSYCNQPPPSIGGLSWEEIRSNKEKLEELIIHLQRQKSTLP